VVSGETEFHHVTQARCSWHGPNATLRRGKHRRCGVLTDNRTKHIQFVDNVLFQEDFTVTDIVVARVAHILAVVLWIGGVGMVTTVLLPAIRRSYPAEQRFGIFHAMEARFARQARVTTLITGISGLYMTWRLDAWSRFQTSDFWWMHAMVLTWFVFTAMLFLIEPLFLCTTSRRGAGGNLSKHRMVAPLPACSKSGDNRRCGCGQYGSQPV
jgi:uncharacterized membrane protein